jgi:hypothetical protein
MGTVEPELDALEKELAGETQEEPHLFLALVLARMKTNPEEFNPDNNSWRPLIEQSKQYLTTEEKSLLKAAEREFVLGHLHAKMMGKLLVGKNPLATGFRISGNVTTLGVTAYAGPRHWSIYEQYIEACKEIYKTVDPNDE